MSRMTYFRNLVWIGVCSLLACAQLSLATLISEYTFDSDDPPLNVSSSDSEPNTLSNPIFAGDGGSIARYDGSVYNPANQVTAAGISMMTFSSLHDETSLSDAVDNDVYFAFTIEPSLGYTVNISEFQGGVRRSASSTTRGWLLRSSVTGTNDLASDSSIASFRTSGLESMDAETSGTPLSPGTDTPSDTIDLSGFSDLQGLTGPVTFYVYSNTGGGGGRTIDYDNIRVYGTVVPEPTTMSLLLVSLLMAGLFRKRRR